MHLSRTANILLVVIAVVFILIITKTYLVPFVLSLIVWYIIREGRQLLRKSAFIRKRFPNWLQNIIVFGIIFLILYMSVGLIGSNIEQFSKEVPTYQKNIEKIKSSVEEGISIDIVSEIEKYSEDLDLAAIIQNILNSLTSFISDGFIVIIYVVFLLLEEPTFPKKLRALFSTEESYKKGTSILNSIDSMFSKYIVVKTLISLLTGVVSYIILVLIGVNFAVLWAFLIFLLNYIPNVGSLLATLFPILAAMLQFGSVLPGLYVLLGVGATQVIVGNVIEPKVMGNSLNISGLVVIITLFAWGAIWGILGMVLSVPITVMMIIIFAQFPSTRGIAVMLSDDGQIDDIK